MPNDQQDEGAPAQTNALVPTSSLLPPAVEPTDETEELARRVRELTACFENSMQRTLEQMCDAGDALRAAKRAVPHGEFGPWLKKNCAMGKRWAENAMDLAEHRDLVLSEAHRRENESGAHLTITSALKLIRAMRRQDKPLEATPPISSSSDRGSELEQEPPLLKAATDDEILDEIFSRMNKNLMAKMLARQKSLLLNIVNPL